jgi:hypothetical protein
MSRAARVRSHLIERHAQQARDVERDVVIFEPPDVIVT